MKTRDLEEIEDELTTVSSQLCVVGGGIAGLLLAYRLAKQGRKVLVVESGHTSFDAQIHRLNEIEDPEGRYGRALDGRYRGLGGSSTRWGGRMIPIATPERAARPHVGQPAWPIPASSLDVYEHEIEKLFAVDTGPYEGEPFGDADAGAYFLTGSEDIAARWAKCPRFKRCNIATVLARQLRELGGIETWLGATVCGFDLDRDAGRLAGLTARSLGGKRLHVRAEQFVFAAGTIETTRLLLLLDAAADGRPFEGCEALGRYFQDHLKARVATIDRSNADFTNRLFAYRFVRSTRRDLHLDLAQTAQQEDGTASAFAYIAMDLSASPLASIRAVLRGLQRREPALGEMARAAGNLGLVARSLYWRYVKDQVFAPPDVDFDLMVCAEQLPHTANRIRLGTERDRFGLPKALLEWKPREADERTFGSAVARLGSYWSKAGFDRLCPLRWTPEASEGPPALVRHAQACAHPSGSTRMGSDARHSVVGPDLRCHAVPNVAIASASVFPTAGSANPTLTIMKIALWLADSYRGAAGEPAPS